MIMLYGSRRSSHHATTWAGCDFSSWWAKIQPARRHETRKSGAALIPTTLASAPLPRARAHPRIHSGVPRLTAQHRHHGRDLAAMMGSMIGDVLQQRTERRAERLALGVLVFHVAGQVGFGNALDERLLLGFHGLPSSAHGGHRRQVGAGLARRRSSLPAAQPDPV